MPKNVQHYFQVQRAKRAAGINVLLKLSEKITHVKMLYFIDGFIVFILYDH